MIFLLFLSFLFADDRIVSLNPTLTEILFDLDLGNRIVGTTTFSNFPDAAKKIKTIGSYSKPSLEKIIELKPTHVLAFIEGDPEIVASLKKAKTPLFSYAARNLGDYVNILTELGGLFNKQTRANTLIKNWNENWDKVKKINIGKTAIIQVDHDPIYLAGGDTFISQSFERCGVKNAFDTTPGYKTIQIESLGKAKPQIVLFVGNVPNKTLILNIENFWEANPLSKNIPVFIGDANVLSRLGPRLPGGILSFCQQVRSRL